MYPEIVIGCPVANRDWILPQWLDHVHSSIPFDWDYKFVFVVPSWDMKSLAILEQCNKAKIIISDEPRISEERSWGDSGRFLHMANLRNELLREVRIIKPKYFLSLDSDILINSSTISELSETLSSNKENKVHAVAGYTYLDPTDKHCTNVGLWKSYPSMNGFTRVETTGVNNVDIIMAIKLMDNFAYNINYNYHALGEDLGWSKNANRSRIKLLVDGRTPVKHVMNKESLNRIDKRVGW